MTLDRDRLARIIAAGSGDIEEWRLGDASLAARKGYPRTFETPPIDDYGIVFIDITLDACSGDLVCHEVNGPNAAGSDALTGDSGSRAANEAEQAVRRAHEAGFLRADGSVAHPFATVHAHQHWAFFRTGGEFYPRVARFADALEALLPAASITCRAAHEAPGNEDITVFMGDVPTIGAGLSYDEGAATFYRAGRPVVFLGNPNILSDMIRTGSLDRAARSSANPAMRVLHAWRFAGLIHDKGRQQDLLRGTGIRPLRHFVAGTADEAVNESLRMLDHGPFVLKPSDTSGGTGVTVLVPGMDRATIAERIDGLLEACRRKYADNAERMVFPLRGFEFVRSTGFPLEGGERLWDLRIAVQFEPERAEAYPVTLRLTPRAFDPATFHDDRDQWVSNVGGRKETLLRSGMDDAVLEAVGLTPVRMDEALSACLRWTEKAWTAMIV